MPEQEAQDTTTSSERLEELSHDPILRIVVASNPVAPASLLETLATDQDVQVRAAVASNPNTPWPTLEKLAREFPQAFLHNPVGPLQLLTAPERISRSPLFWEALLQEPFIPSWWWQWLWSNFQSWQTVRLHILATGEHVHWENLSDEEEETLLALVDLLSLHNRSASSLLLFPNTVLPDGSAWTSEQVIEASMQRLTASARANIRVAVAQMPMPEAPLQILAHDREEDVREAVAANEHTPRAVLVALADDPSSNVCAEVASNKQTPVELLRALAGNDQGIGRVGVAQHSQTPRAILRALAHDKNWLVRSNVAANEHTPRVVLRTLALDQDNTVRENVARNKQTPKAILHALAQDQDSTMRRNVAANVHTPRVVLRTLALDQDGWVRRNVAANEHTPRAVLRTLAQDQEKWVRRNVVKNKQTPETSLCTLAQDQDNVVRRGVAENSRTPRTVLHALAQDQDNNVRETVAANARTPKALLQALTQDQGIWVQWVATHHLEHLLVIKHPWQALRKGGRRRAFQFERSNRNAPIEDQLKGVAMLDVPTSQRQMILVCLASTWETATLSRAFRPPYRGPSEYTDPFLDEFAEKHKNLEALLAPFVPALALQKLATSPSWEVRAAVALHEQTPWETRQRLSQDGNRYVRALARAKAAQFTVQGMA